MAKTIPVAETPEEEEPEVNAIVPHPDNALVMCCQKMGMLDIKPEIKKVGSILRGWISDLFNDLEARVSEAFITHKEHIDDLADNQAKMLWVQEQHAEAVKSLKLTIKETKKALEDMRDEGQTQGR